MNTQLFQSMILINSVNLLYRIMFTWTLWDLGWGAAVYN